jgi:hypothetical protein
MPSLLELQRDFAAALISGETGRLKHELIFGARELDATAALSVYRNNVFSNYRKALLDDFPAVAALVGDRFFEGACDAYVRAHRCESGDLNDFGAMFGSFLQQWPPAQGLPYLADVARLEWAVHVAFNAGDVPGLELSELAHVAPDRLPALRFDLHPSAVLMHSAYPVLEIWRTSTGKSDERVQLDAGEDHLLIIRREGNVQIEPLAVAQFAALQALREGRELTEAHQLACAADAAFDLGVFLQQHVLGQTLIAFHLPQT